jgi:hypothetical protein
MQSVWAEKRKKEREFEKGMAGTLDGDLQGFVYKFDQIMEKYLGSFGPTLD